MRRSLALIALSATALLGGCTTPDGSGPGGQLTGAEKVAKTESVAFEAERQLNLAEKSLENLDPDAAESQLKAARRYLGDPKIDGYPEADLLRSRHGELAAQIPGVREEVARRKLAAEVAAAKEKIEASKTELKAAIGDIKRRDPDESAFSRADAAVDALRSALDDSSSLESKDAPFGKYAISTRKLLEKDRQVLEARRIQVAVDTGKAEIGGTLEVLTAAVRQLRSKDAGFSDVDRAREAAEKVDAAIQKRESIGDKDIPFAKYVASSRQKLAANKKSIEDAHHALTVDAQKAQVEASRQTLREALARIATKSADAAAFEDAEAQAKGLQEALRKGEALESKDRGYAGYASKITKEHQAAVTRIAGRRLELRIQAAKAEIGARRDLLSEALRRIAANDPTDADFGSAASAVEAVEKAVEGASALRTRDRGLASYILQTEKSLVPARNLIRRRKLEVQVAEQNKKLSAALEQLADTTRNINEPADFAAADSAVAGLEKTLEEGEKYQAKNVKYAKRVTAARKQAAAARKRIKTRRDEVAMSEQKAKVEVKRERLSEIVEGLSGFTPSEEQFKAALDAWEETNKALDEGDALEQRLKQYRSYAMNVRKSLANTKKKIEAKQLAGEVRNRRMLVEQAIESAKVSVGEAKKSESTEAELKAASDALIAAREEIATGVTLEKREREYGRLAGQWRRQLKGLQATLDAAKPAVEFREGPIATLLEARSKADTAEGLAEEEQRTAYRTALDGFHKCENDAKSLLSEHRKLAKLSFVVGRKKLKGASVAKTCGTEAKSVDRKLAAVARRLAFYEGPAKHFTEGSNQLVRAEQSASDASRLEALSAAIRAFEECVGEGRILGHKYKALKKERFDLDGRKITLPILIKACQGGAKRARSLKAKKG